ncbi:MAG: hypothetical protein K8T91_17490 [Planctomycetes bacterium]|nr:hypothetical protein [Planctomycetota bacterium]
MLHTRDLKFWFSGHILVQQPVLLGLWKRQRQIPIGIGFDHVEESSRSVWETSAYASICARKIGIHDISFGLEATAEIHATEGWIIIRERWSQNGQWTFSGTFSHDRRMISGTVDMEKLDCDGIRGTFLHSPFEVIAASSISGAFLFDGIREDLCNDVKDLCHNGYEEQYASLLVDLESFDEYPDLMVSDRLNCIMKEYRHCCHANRRHELISAAVDELKVLEQTNTRSAP